MVLYTIDAIAYVFMITLFVYRFVARGDKRRWQKLTMFLVFVALGTILFVLEGASGEVLLQLILGMIIFNGMIPTYGTDINFVYIVFGVGYVLLSYVLGIALIAQAMLFGMLSEVVMMKSVREKHGSALVENRRDVLQVTAGIIFIAMFYYLQQITVEMILIAVILAGIFLLNYAKTMRSRGFSGFIHGLERRNASLGHGALWLAMGTLVAISFLQKPYVMVALAAIFIGDSMATIVGMGYRSRRLTYNKGKSVAGTFTYFLSTFVVSYLFVGWIALPLAVVAAVVESLSWRIDDNFSVSVVLVALLLAISRI